MQIQRFQLSKEIIHGDGFVGMPATAQALYLQICSVADDEGFTSQLDMCKFLAHASDDDVKILIDREFILQVGERKVTVVKHWKMNAWLRKVDRSKFEERRLIYVNKNDNYTLDSSAGVPLDEWHDSDCAAVEQQSSSDDAAQMRPSHSDTPTQTSARRPIPNHTKPYHTNNNTGQGLGRTPTREENDDDKPF